MHTVFNENVRITIKPKLNEKQKHTKKKNMRNKAPTWCGGGERWNYL